PARARDRRRALERYRAPLTSAPNASGASRALHDLEAGDEASHELALLGDAIGQAGQAGEPAAAMALHLRAAQLWLGRTPARLDPAIAHLHRAFAHDPHDDETFRLLDGALAQAGRPLERAQAHEEAAREAHAPRRAERLLAAATLYEQL